MPKRTPAAERFWPKVDQGAPNECWEWTASKTSRGYGKFGWERRDQWISAHRAAWLICNGPIPDGLEVDHICHNPGCVNPSHLQLLTHAENMRRTRAALATHCKRNHAYDGSTSPATGRRYCRECQRYRDSKRTRNRSKKEADY